MLDVTLLTVGEGGNVSSVSQSAAAEESGGDGSNGSGKKRREAKKENPRASDERKASDRRGSVGEGTVHARTFPKAHAKGGNTALSCWLGVATILSTKAFTEEGCRCDETKETRGGEKKKGE